MHCPTCGTNNPDKARFCLNCGSLLAARCGQCGAELPPQARFCLECGANVAIAALKRIAPRESAGSDRRLVTALFTDIVGSTSLAQRMDPEDWREIVIGAHQVVSEAVCRHEGTVAQLLGDGVLAFFGAPVAHEDDVARAVRAALEIQAAWRPTRRNLRSVTACPSSGCASG
jgi:class 3 adenylate cyclase